MDNLQINLSNYFILALWCLIIPCLSGLIYLFLSKSEEKKTVSGNKKVVKVSILAFVVFSLLVVVGKVTIDAQAINPLCVGVGDPSQMMCFGRSFVPMNEAIVINSSKLSSDLIRTLGIPIVLSVSLAVLIIAIQRVRKKGLQNFTQ